MAANTSRGVKEIGAQLLKPGGSRGQPAAFADPELVGSLGLPLELRRSLQRGGAAYVEVCAACHAPDGKGAPLGGATDGTTLAPPLAGSARVVGHSRLRRQGAAARHDRGARWEGTTPAA